MGMPTLIGAGVGAVGSAITGQSPLKGALLGRLVQTLQELQLLLEWALIIYLVQYQQQA